MAHSSLRLAPHVKDRAIELGHELVSAGVVNHGQVYGGMLKAMAEEWEGQTATQSGARNGKPSMTTAEFRVYLKSMAPRVLEVAETMEQQASSPHEREIALGMLKTAEFIRRLSEQKEQDIQLREQLRQEIERCQMELYQKEREAEQKKEQQKEGFSLGSKIGGLFDEMLKLLQGEEKSAARSVEQQALEVGKRGLSGCAITNEKFNARSTPGHAIPEKQVGIGMPLKPAP